MRTRSGSARTTFLLALALAACGGDDEKNKAGGGPGSGGDGGVPSPECQSSRDYFAREVWAPVLGKICIDCHVTGGIAPAQGASFVLTPPGYPGFLEANFEEMRRLGRTTYDGTPILLLKPTGALDHGGGQVLVEGSPELDALGELAKRLEEVDACPIPPAASLGGLELLDAKSTLRKASLALTGRLPTLAERDRAAAEGEGALGALVDGLLAEPAFLDWVRETWNDVLLTDRYLSYDAHALNVLEQDDFPWADTAQYSLPDDQKRATNRAVAREPLELIAHVVEAGRPFTEIVTADYTMLNDASAAVYNVSAPPADALAAGELREAKIVSRRDGLEIAWPHAGVLTSPMFLARYPTTPTNLNRLRSRKVFEYFLATDILQIAERPIDAQESAAYINPTRDDPSCNQCHRQLDPVAGAFLRFGDYSPTSYQPDHEWHPEMFAPGFAGETMAVAEFDRAPQWLGARVAQDPRFARAVVHHVLRALTGQGPLAYPRDADDAAHAARLAAWEAQEGFLARLAADFAAGGFDFRSVVKAVVLSPYFRASRVADGATPDDVARLADVGTARLLTPEALGRKIVAVTGAAWAREWDLRGWLSTDYRILYGGIDSDLVVERLTAPNGVMGAVIERMANEVACAATSWDLRKPRGERLLFPEVELTDTDASALPAIRANVRALHALLLGEELAEGDPELERTVQLFIDTRAEGAAKVESDALGRSLPWACQARRDLVTGEDIPEADRLREDPDYVVRAWMAVVTYLLGDYRFLYE
ncbi:MAG: DUF1592 domain-containing protein [Deltaproteobacteria bacterium]|nr:DUF1592 domain-containing protein [Deltaproteobacteria bacterium]